MTLDTIITRIIAFSRFSPRLGTVHTTLGVPAVYVYSRSVDTNIIHWAI